MAERGNTTRNAAICALAFAACFWLAWPVAEIGFSDDWSYIKSAQVFAHTGHIVYNGWAAMILGWQIPWGALFSRLFGFSFMAVKLSTFPLAVTSVFIFYLIQSRFGINTRNAVIGTLTLGLSPLFLPLSASFMSDVPSLFVVLVCLYLCQRAVAAHTNAGTIAWLSLAAAFNVVGGTVRQIVWLGALVMVPSTVWFLRKRHRVLFAGSLLWVGTTASVLYFMHWFSTQPYAAREPFFLLSGHAVTESIFTTLLVSLSGFLCLAFVAWPALIAWLPQARKTRNQVLILAICGSMWAAFQWINHWTFPWIPHVIAAEFTSARSAFVDPDSGPYVFSPLIRAIVSLLVVATILAFITTVQREVPHHKNLSEYLFWRKIFYLLAPYSLAYWFMLAVLGKILDRYLLLLLPMVIVCLILLYQRWITPNLPGISVVFLAIYALLAVAGTHDWFAWQRARLAAINEIRASGVPRSEIEGGFDYDGWTQIENGGHINNPIIKFPANSYQPYPVASQIMGPCKVTFAPFTPAVHPIYTVAFARPMSCLSPSTYSPIQFRAWLPPFSRTVYVQKIPKSHAVKDSGSPLPADASDPLRLR